jgi:hypothetical protein
MRHEKCFCWRAALELAVGTSIGCFVAFLAFVLLLWISAGGGR